jgi:hypothetical protein
LSREEEEKDAKALKAKQEADAQQEGEKCTCHAKDPMMIPGMVEKEEKKDGDEEEEEDDEQHQLSYKNLIKFIEQYHPVHPLTKERFAYGQRVTVKDYQIKLWDPCYLYVVVKQCKKACGKYYKLSRGNVDDRKGARPETLKGLPESPSDSSELEDEVGFGGLTAGGAHLGVGAILYLQTMKTFALLFLILTIFNLPVYFVYSQATQKNDYGDLNAAFQYFTVGNLGGTNRACSSTPITFDASEPQGSFNLSCGLEHHYMTGVETFGFLYMFDPRFEAETDGDYICESISGVNGAREPLSNPPAQTAEDASSRLLTGLRDEVSQTGEEIVDQDSAETEEENTAEEGPRRLESAEGGGLAEGEHTPVEELGEVVAEAPPRISQNATEYNLDTLCQTNSEFLYADAEARAALEDYFDVNCYYKAECTFNLDDIGGKKFSDLVSPFCQERVVGNPEAATVEMQQAPVVDTSQLLFVVGCQSSTYQIQGYYMHKQQLACLAVLFDVVGVYFMLYVFNKLQRLNQEYIDIIDDNQITMKDFSVQCRDVLLDKYTQDIRLIKMKIWLHFTRQFAEYRLEDNNYEVVDVALSLCNKPETLQIFKMEQTQHEINLIKSKLGAGEFKDAQFFQKKEELEDLNDMYER